MDLGRDAALEMPSATISCPKQRCSVTVDKLAGLA